MNKKQVNARWMEACRRDRDEAGQDPTQVELAMLAASLATGNESSSPEACRRLAERALAIWDGAGEALRNRADRRAFPDQTRERWAAAFRRAKLEPPEVGKNFTFNGALLFLMTDRKRPADRRKALRDYLRAEIARDRLAFSQSVEEVSLPAEERVLREMERLREKGFDYGSFCRFAERFLPWLENDLSVKRAEAGSKGGLAEG